MLQTAIPVLYVSDILSSLRFYEQLGFEQRFCYQPGAQDNPAYLGLQKDGVTIHLSSFSGDGSHPGVIYFIVNDVDGLYEQWKAAGIEISLPPTDQTWNNREMYVEDPDRNSLRFVVEKPQGLAPPSSTEAIIIQRLETRNR